MAELVYIHERGVIVPDTAETRNQVVEEFKAALGQDLPTDPETPQGVLITMLAQERDNTARAMAEMANQINPAQAQGVFLDGLMALMGGARLSATHSTIAGVRLGGVPGTVIPPGSRVVSEAGDVFLTASTAIIDSNGEAFVDVRAVEAGPIEVAAGDLVTVAESVLGWETVSNVNPAVVGRDEETDTRARNRRRNILALNTTSTNEAIISRLYAIPAVQSLAFRENYTANPMTIDGVTLKPHSIYVVVNGGLDVDIAQALKDTKTIGGGYNGEEEVTIIDEVSGQPYTVQFDRPDQVDLFARVTVAPSAVNAQQVVRNAIDMMTAGEIQGDEGLVVGRSISPFEIAAAINFVEPELFVRRVELSTNGVDWSTEEQEITIQQIASLPSTAVQVVVT